MLHKNHVTNRCREGLNLSYVFTVQQKQVFLNKNECLSISNRTGAINYTHKFALGPSSVLIEQQR
jgi:hypothetical protein